MENTIVKAEKGIPLPAEGRRGRKIRYPWESMEIGESFKCNSTLAYYANAAAANANLKYSPKKFHGFYDSAKKENRIWRTK